MEYELQNACAHCGGNPLAPDHAARCDGQQGRIEADLPFDRASAAPDFDGETYERERDHDRLGAQALRVWTVIRAGEWLTLREIADRTGDPEASVSARLRDFRKWKFGGHQIERRNVDRGYGGTWEYRLGKAA